MDEYSVVGINDQNVYFMLGFLEQHLNPAQWEAARIAAIEAYPSAA